MGQYHVVITFTLEKCKNYSVYRQIYASFLNKNINFDEFKLLEDIKDKLLNLQIFLNSYDTSHRNNLLPNTTILSEILASSEDDAKRKASHDVRNVLTIIKSVNKNIFTVSRVLISVSAIKPECFEVDKLVTAAQSEITEQCLATTDYHVVIIFDLKEGMDNIYKVIDSSFDDSFVSVSYPNNLPHTTFVKKINAYSKEDAQEKAIKKAKSIFQTHQAHFASAKVLVLVSDTKPELILI